MHTFKGNELIEDLGIDYFKKGSTFGALSESAIRFLIEQGEILHLDKNDQLFEFGDPGGCFHIILKGTVRFHRLRGEISYVRDFTFGEQLGIAGMIALHERLGSALAIEESIVLKVTNSLFFDLHERMPTDFGILLLNLSREMARLISEYG